jgi:hypothetical protein
MSHGMASGAAAPGGSDYEADTRTVDGDVSITAPDANNVFVGFFDDEDSDTFKVAESANGLSLTIEPVDPHELGFVVITGTIGRLRTRVCPKQALA